MNKKHRRKQREDELRCPVVGCDRLLLVTQQGPTTRVACPVHGPICEVQEDLWWWLAINRDSVAASPTPMSRGLVVRPHPEQLLGYKTQEEQLAAQGLLLTAPPAAVHQYMQETFPARRRAGEVVYIRPRHPEPPTRGTTVWGDGAVADLLG